MQLEFWHQRWHENQIGFHQREINAHLQTFWPELRLPGDSSVFVPLCGKSRDMLWLRAQGHSVLGVEISPLAVRDFFAENRLQATRLRQGRFERWESDGLTILCGDFFHLDAAWMAGVNAVYDRASLIALPAAMRQSYAQHFISVVPGDAEVLLVTMEYDQAEMAGPPFAVHEPEIDALFGTDYGINQLYCEDILEENPRFRQKGLRALQERVYRLRPLHC